MRSDCQEIAITNLEASFNAPQSSALIQMATGAGKTYTAIPAIYWLLKESEPDEAAEEINRQSPISIYQTTDCSISTGVQLERETVWLSQQQICQLFRRERSVITQHLRNIFVEGEQDAKLVCVIFAHTADDGKTYKVGHYNLNAMLLAPRNLGGRKQPGGTLAQIWPRSDRRPRQDQPRYFLVKGQEPGRSRQPARAG